MDSGCPQSSPKSAKRTSGRGQNEPRDSPGRPPGAPEGPVRLKISMSELHPGVGACGRRPLRVRRPRGVRRAGRQGGTVKGTVSLHSCKRVTGGSGAKNIQGLCWVPGRVDFYAQARRIWPRAAPGLRWGSSGAPGGVREGFRSSFWCLRRSFLRF